MTTPCPTRAALLSAIRRATVLTGLALLGAASVQGQRKALALPEAPSALVHAAGTTEAPVDATAKIQGTVVDASGALVPGANIKLELNAGHGFLSDTPKPGELEKLYQQVSETSSDSAGNFVFPNLAPGIYRVLIAAKGLEPFLSKRIYLQAGQHFEMPETALLVADAGLAVTVYATSEEVAEAELKLETQQRVLGIVPNFYTSFVYNAAPLNTRQKFKLAYKSRTDPFNFVVAGIVAGIETGRDTFPDWGQDGPSYLKRYAAAYGDALFGRFFGSAIFPSVFHQDPRYFYMGPGQPTKKRVLHALAAGVTARGDNGRLQPNYSHILGNASAGALSTVYHPASNSAGSLALDNALIGIAGGSAIGLVREFVLKPFTHKVPPYANGKMDAAKP